MIPARDDGGLDQGCERTVKLERRGEIQEQYDIETELKDGGKWERIRVEEEI